MSRLMHWYVTWQQWGVIAVLTLLIVAVGCGVFHYLYMALAEKWEKYVVQKPDSRSGCCYPDDCECVVCGASNDRLDDESLAEYRRDPNIKSFY